MSFKKINTIHEELGSYKIDKIIDGYEGVEIYICSTQGSAITGVFKFDCYYGYRSFNEGEIYRYLESCNIKGSGVYSSTNSSFLDWAKEQSIEKELPEGLFNYIFASIESIFDILAFAPPQFKLIDINKYKEIVKHPTS